MKQQKEIKDYLLYWEVPEKELQFTRPFKSLWDARCYAYDFDHHVTNVRIYKLEEEIDDIEEE